MNVKAIVFLSLVIIVSSDLLAQKQLEIGLKSSEVMYPSRISKKGIGDNIYFLIDDSLKISISNVKYYQTKKDYFILYRMGRNIIEMRRIVEGVVNVYTLDQPEDDGGEVYYGTNYTTPSNNSDNYIYERDGQLTPLSADNLMTDLRDSELAIKKIESIKKVRNAKIATRVIPVFLVIAGISKNNEQSSMNPDRSAGQGLFITAGILAIAPLFIQHKKEMILIKAVEIYNEERKGNIIN
jgi:hypothetical protein